MDGQAHRPHGGRWRQPMDSRDKEGPLCRELCAGRLAAAARAGPQLVPLSAIGHADDKKPPPCRHQLLPPPAEPRLGPGLRQLPAGRRRLSSRIPCLGTRQPHRHQPHRIQGRTTELGAEPQLHPSTRREAQRQKHPQDAGPCRWRRSRNHPLLHFAESGDQRRRGEIRRQQAAVEECERCGGLCGQRHQLQWLRPPSRQRGSALHQTGFQPD